MPKTMAAQKKTKASKFLTVPKRPVQIDRDIHEILGRNHYQAHPSMNDDELEGSDVVRLGDVIANREEYQEADEWIGSVINQLELSRPYSVREFLLLLGRELSEIAHEDG